MSLTSLSTREATAKAAVLVEALPYIRAHAGKTVVVKLGGAALVDELVAPKVAGDLALLSSVGMRLVVVHGGGPQVSEAMRAAGIEPAFVGGLRVTDDAAMEVVRRVLAGSINSDLVGTLCVAGLRAVGLTGADAALLTCGRRIGANGEDLGRVGSVLETRSQLLTDLLDHGYTPVLTSIAPDGEGGFLNLNADAAAAAVACSLGAAKLVYLTNVAGLYQDLGNEGSLISQLTPSELETMIPTLSAGMRPKAEAAVTALRRGVPKVHVLDGGVEHALLLEVFTDEGIGTQVMA
jgi:acetylglutamate kinase